MVAVHRDFANKINHTNGLLQQYHNTLESYKSKLSAITSTLERLKSFPEPVSRDDSRLAIKEKIKAHRESTLAVQQEKNKLEDAVKIFSNSGVKSHVLDLVTPFLNERANKYLSALAGSDMELIFSTQTKKKDGEMSEKFDVQLLNAVGGDTYKSNSDGERKRADLAIAHALQDYVITRGDSPVNFLLYDEILDGLDEVGVENVIHLLKEKQKQIGTLFVITHSSALKNLFEKVITVTKKPDGNSVLEEGANIT
jgi:DNA repair exonuclease SbcCD ATPase subunit